MLSTPRSAVSSKSITPIPSPSAGPNLPTISSPPSNDSASEMCQNELLVHDTSAENAIMRRRASLPVVWWVYVKFSLPFSLYQDCSEFTDRSMGNARRPYHLNAGVAELPPKCIVIVYA